jgi:hypothetical protein
MSGFQLDKANGRNKKSDMLEPEGDQIKQYAFHLYTSIFIKSQNPPQDNLPIIG